MKYKILCCLLIIQCQVTLLCAQQDTGYVWWNPTQSDFPVIEGQAWPQEVKNPYDRLPARAEKTVRDAVWHLSQQSAGLLIRFQSDASQIVVHYGVGGNLDMPHMPSTGVSGVDLYAINSDGDWLWCAGKYAFGDTIEYRYEHLTPNDGYHEKGRTYQLYLPLYNSVRWLEIGVPDSAAFRPLPVRAEKPVVVYGTSIAQGACASRPGMAWTAMLERKLDRPLVNLGFSGNGRLEPEVIELLLDIDAKVYVLDCLPNLTSRSDFTQEEVKDRIMASVRQIRQKRAHIPVLLVEHDGYSGALINKLSYQQYTRVNEALRQAFAQLKSEGVQELYVLTKDEINQCLDCMVDGTHPSDLGMQRYADAYEKSIRSILHEPEGTYVTTKPCTQNRDGKIYDWETRHEELLAMNKSHPPRIIFLGNSITHYWAGEPKAPISRGNDSWQQVLAPLGTRNFGFGWDRVENVLWRVYHDELDGYQAAQTVIMIGTNNLGFNSDKEIIAGLKFLVQAIKIRQPNTSIVLLGLFPRRQQEDRVADLNQQMALLSGAMNVVYADVGEVLLNKEGAIDESLFVDGLHPNAEGYRKVAQLLKPYLIPAP